MDFITLFISLAFVNNIVLNGFLAICPLIGVSKNPKNALNMGYAVTFVIFMASIICYFIYNYVLVPLEIDYLQIITFILVIASLVQFVEMFLKKTSPEIYKSMGVYLPLITTNCAVLGTITNYITKNQYCTSLLDAIVIGLAVPIGFTIVMVVFSRIRERLEIANVPDSFKGTPIAFIVLAFMAMALSGLAGIV